MHVTADYELCRLILRDRRFGVVTPSHPALPKPIRWMLGKTDLGLPNLAEPPSMLMTDPPDHTRYRRMVGQAFGPKAIATLEERIAEVADDLLVRLKSNPRPDLIGDFSAQLPVAIIAEILGLPADMHSTLLKWGDSGAPLLERGLAWSTYRDAMKDLAEVKQYFDQHFDGLTAEPHDDVLSMLVTHDGLTRREQMANAALLLDAGFLTTVNMLGNGIALLTSHPDQLELLAAQPGLWPNAVEEILRYDGPVRMTGRVANCDVDLDHQRIKSGSLVLLSLAGANNDPASLPRPAAIRCDQGQRRGKSRVQQRDTRLPRSQACPNGRRHRAASPLRSVPESAPGRPTHPSSPANLHAYRSMPAKLPAD